jgi:kynurenine--oxoglutarate transaminase/cysteine-S-conjugate beta-lyase/glutamine--phenylpyruvate transaminase
MLQGHPRLVNAVAKFYSKLINRDLDPNKEVLITVGAYEALYSTLQGHTNPGDEWIIIEPFFDCYVPMVQSAGGVPRYIALKPVGILSDKYDMKVIRRTQEKAM